MPVFTDILSLFSRTFCGSCFFFTFMTQFSLKNINVMFIVLEMTAATKTKEQREVFSFKVADGTAAINCSIWDEPGKLLQPGDIVRLLKCYANTFRGCLTLYSGKSGELSRMGDFCMNFNEQLNMSEPVASIRNPSQAPVNNGTNGNGRANSAAPQTSSVPAIATNNHTTAPGTEGNIRTAEKPKVNNNNSRNYIRKPINRK